jgi:DNA-binding response OmpR family regulator
VPVTGMDYKILLVDNNPVLLDLLKTVLQSIGYSVKTSLRYAFAKELTEIWKPNLIIIDTKIEDIKASRFIQEIQGSSTIPTLIFCSMDNSV